MDIVERLRSNAFDEAICPQHGIDVTVYFLYANGHLVCWFDGFSEEFNCELPQSAVIM
jgi:hypothetical protein